MDKENINISKIETFMYGIVGNAVSANTYVGSLPDTIKPSWNDMVLVDIGTDIYDLTAMGRGIVHVYLYAKPLGNGSKNVKVMSELERKLDIVISSVNDSRYCLNVSYRDTGFDTERKWHYTIVALNLMIF